MASPAASSRRSAGSSAASLRRSDEKRASSTTSIPVESLVNHLLAAKRSLSSMNHVLRANELATTARNVQEEAHILKAQSGFLRGATLDQAAILVRVRRSLQATYDWGKKDFKVLIRAMDEVDGELERTMEMLRATNVQSVDTSDSEERKNLLDYVDEDSVNKIRDAMKKSIQELQVRLSRRIYTNRNGSANRHRLSSSHSMVTCFALTRISATSKRLLSKDPHRNRTKMNKRR